mmetsp:Transcript_9099/g.15383  ORF Transcript_9099/g.15383 Transcript_9099/m.15383 type:complete len:236 (+) Transcript_9099:74-781(+)
MISRNALVRSVRLAIMSHRCCSTSFIQKKLEMPKFMDASVGCVEKWLKKQGDTFTAGETICEVTIDGVTLGIDQKEGGVLADILVAEEADVPVGKTLAIVVNSADDYDAFIAKFKNLQEDVNEDSTTSETTTSTSSMKQEPTSTADGASDTSHNIIILIKAVKNLIKTGAINEEDDFAHDLLSLCRHDDNQELLDAFQASYDGDEFNEATFEESFFISSARSIVAKHQLDDAVSK